MSNWGRFLEARLAVIDEMTREERAPLDIRRAINVDGEQLQLLQMTARSRRPRPADVEASDVRRWVAAAARLPAHCSQCGLSWRARACGPTHAAVAAARAARTRKRKARGR